MEALLCHTDPLLSLGILGLDSGISPITEDFRKPQAPEPQKPREFSMNWGWSGGRSIEIDYLYENIAGEREKAGFLPEKKTLRSRPQPACADLFLLSHRVSEYLHLSELLL